MRPLSVFVLLAAATLHAEKPKVFVPNHKVYIPTPMTVGAAVMVVENGIDTGKIVRTQIQKACGPSVDVVSDPQSADYTVTTRELRAGADIHDRTGAIVLSLTDTKNEKKLAREACAFLAR